MKNYILACFLTAAVACNNTHNNESTTENNSAIPQTASDSLYKAVLDGHDTGMAKMKEISGLQALVKQQRDSINNLKVKASSNIADYDTAYSDLEQAKKLMNDWMHDFEPDNAGTTEDEKLGFYRKEKEKIDTVNARINSSIEKAKEITAAKP